MLAAVVVFFALLAVGLHADLFLCMNTCFIDHHRVFADPLRDYLTYDSRLNAWILAWVQRALLNTPLDVFDSNTFHPAPATLTASEHMISIATATFPLRLLTDSAVGIHNSVILLSSMLTGVCTYLLVFYATARRSASLLAGAIAMTMPWRHVETGHIQLLSTFCIPLIWLLLDRIVESGVQARRIALLAVLLGFELLASYYLAYFTLCSVAVFLACALLVGWRPGGRQLAGVLLGLAIPVAAAAVVSLPYLHAKATGGFDLVHAYLSTGFSDVWREMASGVFRESLTSKRFPYYGIPPGVLAVMTLSLVSMRRTRDGDVHSDRCRRLTACLGAIVVVAIVMAAGPTTTIDGKSVTLPYSWAMSIVPGFSQLRGPIRWLILAAVAAPPLVGLGIDRVLKLSALQPGRRQAVTWVAIVMVLLWTTSWRRLEVAPSGPSPQLAAGYAELAQLPPGPVLEIPWHVSAGAVADSAYMLASTIHWHPVLNGYSGYPPPSYYLLKDIALALPKPEAVRRLTEMAGVRWFVLHKAFQDQPGFAKWRQAEESSGLVNRYEDASMMILENPSWTETTEAFAALSSSRLRDMTLDGTPKVPLPKAQISGRLEVDSTGVTRVAVGVFGRRNVPYRLTNSSPMPWPMFDVQHRNLVRLRYRYFAKNTTTVLGSRVLTLRHDVFPGETVADDFGLEPPWIAGSYTLVIDLVQQLETGPSPLPIQEVRFDIDVEPTASP